MGLHSPWSQAFDLESGLSIDLSSVLIATSQEDIDDVTGLDQSLICLIN